eukprot:TRINITY_DN4998_c3_g1_i2.p1 TRINITY_DN4998_c3_g1~~TRINITY_DN4998_c3_g1_i2.p1  ORF type:complete len:787 (+),score=258.78 TRINITY_DN4998_c3_g1_i2:69-2429(+)
MKIYSSLSIFSKLFVVVIICTSFLIVSSTILSRENDIKIKKSYNTFSDNVNRLLDSLTLEEKIGQMTQLDSPIIMNTNSYHLNETSLYEGVNKFGVGNYFGSIFAGGPVDGKVGFTSRDWCNLINQIQNIAREASTTDTFIPILYGLDSIHGGNFVYDSTSFPHNFGLGATFNRSLIEESFAISTKDTRASGVPLFFGPVAGIGIQPLWPRYYETFSEDPYLASEMVKYAIYGIEGKEKNISSPVKCASCIKHFLGYPDPRSGKDRGNAWISERQLRQYFLPPFQVGIEEANSETLMINSGAINSIPVHSSKEILTDLLRNELNFQGVDFTDYGDLEKLVDFHHIASNLAEATKIAIDAGIDVSMVPLDYSFSEILYQLVSDNIIDESVIDNSCGRVLQLKEDLGLLDPSKQFCSIDSNEIKSVGSKEDKEVALQSMRESITLLKNNNILPLDVDNIDKVLVTGYCGDNLGCQNGGWSLYWQGTNDTFAFPYGTSVVDGIRTYTNRNINVEYKIGASFDSLINVDEVIAEAQDSDAIILVIGDPPEAEWFGDIDDLAFPHPQLELYDILAENVKAPIILVIFESRPRLINNAANADAILLGYLPGNDGGKAIAEIIFGDVNPSGVLPFTYPRTSGDILPYYHLYSDETNPLFEFGHGLSYTTFKYSNILFTFTSSKTYNYSDLLNENQPIGTVTIDIQNTGNRTGKLPVLMYISDIYRSVSPEVKMLKAFKKIELRSNEKATVSFDISSFDLTFIGRDNSRTIEAGQFVIQIGDLNTDFDLSIKNN